MNVFNSPSTEFKENKSLHAHSIVAINYLGNMIEIGLNDVGQFDAMLINLVRHHSSKSITQSDIDNFGNVVVQYIAETLVKSHTKTLNDALIVLFSRLSSAFDK